MNPGRRTGFWLPWLAVSRAEGAAGLVADAIAGLVVAILLVPQALAYAQLAALPPQTGLYAGLLAPLAYALCGASRVLAAFDLVYLALIV
ncbi:MAG TPA: SulP family inorganic anion transporter, partial [Plasticicumulans sp.]|nr:SulP family inorganic anion transporter [Plasticicumulans sp.]